MRVNNQQLQPSQVQPIDDPQPSANTPLEKNYLWIRVIISIFLFVGTVLWFLSAYLHSWVKPDILVVVIGVVPIVLVAATFFISRDDIIDVIKRISSAISRRNSKTDIIIGYDIFDFRWAAWMKWQLETVGHYITLHDCSDGGGAVNFVGEVRKASKETRCVIAIMPSDYQEQVKDNPKWPHEFRRHYFRGDSILVRVQRRLDKELGSLRGVRQYVDLFENNKVDEAIAREKLLDGLPKRLRRSGKGTTTLN